MLAGTTNRLAGLTIANGHLDVTATAVLVACDGATATAWAATGFDGGNWDGPGITSTAAATDPRRLAAVGVVDNGAGLYTSFDGQAVTAADVLVRSTVYGDANLDGTVTAADYTRLDAGYVTHLTGWANGDFNYDGTVDGSDYTLIDTVFNTRAAATPTRDRHRARAGRRRNGDVRGGLGHATATTTSVTASPPPLAASRTDVRRFAKPQAAGRERQNLERRNEHVWMRAVPARVSTFEVSAFEVSTVEPSRRKSPARPTTSHIIPHVWPVHPRSPVRLPRQVPVDSAAHVGAGRGRG